MVPFWGDLDPEKRASLAEASFKALEATLRERTPDEVKEVISAPEEFRVLARHILRICGPGLPISHNGHMQAFDTIADPLECLLEVTDEEPPVFEGITAENVTYRMVWGLR